MVPLALLAYIGRYMFNVHSYFKVIFYEDDYCIPDSNYHPDVDLDPIFKKKLKPLKKC